MSPLITYRSDVVPAMDAITALYLAAPLYRPLDDLDRMRQMFEQSNIVLTAWDGERLVGLLRGITDGAYSTFVCDLAVHPDVQHAGIGRQLLAQVVAAYPQTGVVLQAARTARDYYRHIGWQPVENGWTSPRPQWSIPSLYSTRP